MSEWKRACGSAALIATVFLLCFFLPVGRQRFDNAVLEALYLARWYAREHVLLCLVPAFFIAGAIAVFVSRASVMRYLGAGAHKGLAYGVAAVSGTLLAVCSCTVLPLFSSIHRMGAGLGPATTFLYSGPAINALAIVLTARVLGMRLGLARAAGAVIASVVIGLLMHLLFRREEAARAAVAAAAGADAPPDRPLRQNAVFFASMVAVLVFANWAQTGDVRAVFLCCPGGLSTFAVEGRIVERTGSEIRMVDTRGQEHRLPSGLLQDAQPAQPAALQSVLYRARWFLAAAAAAVMAFALARFYRPAERREWLARSWGFARQIMPLLLAGVLAAGLALGRPGHEGLIPSAWIGRAVGGNSLGANLFAALAGALMYFATLTEVPILQGLLGSGMGQGPALALLLAGPALSLPSMLVIGSVLGARKTAVFVVLVVSVATLSGFLYGLLAAR
ncbi:MAG: hypothetical protein FJ225_09740 [Lentisphaerae bacterium]|nr:hypothetical protein [Lentisphaerota bacterium]